MGAYTLFYGFFASLLCLIFLYFLGILCLPNTFFKKTNFTLFPFLYGLVVFGFICHWSVSLGFSLSKMFLLFPLLILVAGIIRFRQSNLLGILFKQRTTFLNWLIAYTVFYFLTYIFFPQPDSSHYLPIACLDNDDLWGYLNQARYLLHMDFQNVAHYDYTVSVWQRWDPGTQYIYGLLSVFYGYDLMKATMPLLYLYSALIGLAIFRYCQEVFQLSLKSSIAIVAIILCGPFYRYVVGNFFLASLINTVFFVTLLTETAKIDFLKQEKIFLKTLCFSLPCLLLIIVFYNVVFFLSIIIQCGLLCLVALFTLFQFKTPIKFLLQKIGYAISAILLSAIIAILFFGTSTYISLLKEFSSDVGWSLTWLSPLSLLGVPQIGHLEHSLIGQILLTVLLFILFFGSLYIVIKKNKQTLTPREWGFLCLPLVSIILYDVYFYYNVGSYRAWKFAFYYVVPFAGAIWALIFKVFSTIRHKKTIISILVGLFIAGNAYNAHFKEQPLSKFSAKYQGLEALKYMGSSSFLIEMASTKATFFSAYFIPNKTLYLLSPSYFPMYHLDLEKDSIKQSFFLENGKNCKKNHGVIIENLGCLYPSIPTLLFNKTYSFKEDWPIFLNIDAEYSSAQPWGRWIIGKNFKVTLYVNSKKLVQHQTGTINFQIKPFVYQNLLKEQKITVKWGGNHISSFTLTNDQWITLPYTISDWHETSAHNALSKITIDFSAPDATPPAQIIPYSSTKAPLGIGLIALEVK